MDNENTNNYILQKLKDIDKLDKLCDQDTFALVTHSSFAQPFRGIHTKDGTTHCYMVRAKTSYYSTTYCSTTSYYYRSATQSYCISKIKNPISYEPVLHSELKTTKKWQLTVFYPLNSVLKATKAKEGRKVRKCQNQPVYPPFAEMLFLFELLHGTDHVFFMEFDIFFPWEVSVNTLLSSIPLFPPCKSPSPSPF